MRIALGLLALVAGCEKTDPLFCKENPGASGCPTDAGGSSDDADVDIDMDPGVDARACFGADNYTVCLAAAPSTPLVIADNQTLDTTNDSRCQGPPAAWTTDQGQPDACFVVATSINIANLQVTGTKPLVLVASNAITISGVLDIASHRMPLKTGPGMPTAVTADCPAYPTDPEDNNLGGQGAGGGGAGASFMSAGRNGGAGDNTGFDGGTAYAALMMGPVVLRPGCKGQNGGDGENNAPGGSGGGGGGAVYLLAGSMINFTATGAINASGAGATAAGDQAGGGGGGSGGMVVLYSDTIMGAAGAKIIANGGGGGAGGNNGGGTPGNEPSLATPTTPAATASGCGGCGAGGAGSTGSIPAQLGGDGGDPEGGGGGGGGAGYIVANKTLTNITTSPAPTIIPN